MHDEMYERICTALFGEHANFESAGSTVHEFNGEPLLVRLWRFWVEPGEPRYVWTWGDEWG